MIKLIVFRDRLPDREQQALTAALENLQGTFREITIRQSAFDVTGGSEMYLACARERNGKLNADKTLAQIKKSLNRRQDAYMALLVTGQAIQFRNLRTCFGLCNFREKIAMVSTQPMRGPDEKAFEAALVRTLRHEIGHLLHMAYDPKRAFTEEKTGNHCTRPGCSMRQAVNLAELLLRSREEAGEPFCDLCRDDMHRYLSGIRGWKPYGARS